MAYSTLLPRQEEEVKSEPAKHEDGGVKAVVRGMEELCVSDIVVVGLE